MDDDDELLLLTLPDEPMLEVLSHLSAEDLVAVVRACPRLRGLTQAHLSLWRGKSVGLRGAAQLHELLWAAPHVDRLSVFYQRWRTWTSSAEFSDSGYLWGPEARTTLTLRNVENFTAIMFALAYGLRQLTLVLNNEDLRLSLLHDAYRLEILYITLQGKGRVTGEWPRGLVLPRLRYVMLHCEPEADLSRSTLKALRSLLKAHSERLWSIHLDSERLLPLLDTCPKDLYQLGVVVGEGLFAKLRPLHALENLRVDFGDDDQEYEEVREVEDLLKSWSGPLQGLELINFRPEMVRDLGTYGLTTLHKLVLEDPSRLPLDLGLGPALGRLPLLQTLVLLFVPRVEHLRGLLDARLPALERILVAGWSWCSRRPDCQNGDCPELLPQITELKRLVRAVPRPLHVGVRLDCGMWSSARMTRLLVLHRHLVDESHRCELCPTMKTVFSNYYPADKKKFTVLNVQVK